MCSSECISSLPQGFTLYHTVQSLNVSWESQKESIPYQFTVKIGPTPITCNSTSSTSCMASGLQQGHGYRIVIMNDTETIHNDTYYTMPSKPQNLSENVEAKTTTSVFVVWDPPVGDESHSYLVVWFQKGADAKNDTVTNTSINISGLEPGQMYSITVYTLINDVKSRGVNGIFSTIPMAPTNVRLTKSGRFKRCLQATWNIPKENRQNVEYRIKLIQLGNSARNSTRNYDILRPHIKSKNFCNLMPATKYKVVVWAEAGDQAVRSIETPSNVVTTVPPKPQNLSENVEAKTTTAVFVVWDPPVGDESYNYLVVWLKTGTDAKNDTVTSTSINITGLEPGQMYNITVYTVINGVNSRGVNGIFSTIPMAPTNVRLTKSGRFKRCLQATWNMPKENRQNVEYRIKLIQLGNSARNSTRNYDILRPHIKSKNFCNLMPATKYKVVVWAEAGDQAVRSIETPSNVVTTDIPVSTVVAAAVVSGVLVIVIVVIVAMVIYRRKWVQFNSDRNEVRQSTKVANFITYVDEMCTELYCKLAFEFEHFKIVAISEPFTVGNLPCNQTKNRFPGIIPADRSRVVLLSGDEEEGSDYINASWMPGYNSRREYIICQCPLADTINDHWRMIWENNCQAIVMVTQTVENTIVKCDHYWPYDNEIMFYGDLQVQLVKQVFQPDPEDPEIIITYLTLSQGDEMKFVKHFQYMAWPAQGVPTSTNSFTNFVKLVRTHISLDRPTVVHCSAGVGRSGIFIVLDRLLQTVEEHEDVYVAGIVKELWLHRPFIIQTVVKSIANIMIKT
ncbi:hypothetical protein LSH36_594g03000 [Paralvinella palmiformis]|uniref:Protein-tyrosine-phosphatase n=1 Tax=Paralvinella palmiformis TaxID=53620 RepID=A0AAD9J677_9ANNE|nr:hypothetical protein LSH36_594g03000 [Paralvinella palmiformis]